LDFVDEEDSDRIRSADAIPDVAHSLAY